MTTTAPITLAKGFDTITAGSSYKSSTGTIAIDPTLAYVVNGDSNADTINFAKSTAFNQLYGGSGNDKITGSNTKDSNGNYVGNNLFSGTGNNTLTGGNGNDNLTVDGKGNNVLTDGNGNDLVYVLAAGNDTVTVGTGTDLLYVGGGSTTTITTIGQGVDTLYVAASSTAKATVSTSGFVAAAGSQNLGVATLTTAGHLVDLSAISAGNGFTISDTKGGTTLVGTASANDTINGATGDTITGGTGSNLLNIKGIESITDLGYGDTLNVASGATATATIVSSGWIATASSINSGNTTLNASGHNVDLSAITKGSGFTISDTVGGATLIGTAAGADTIIGAAGDKLTGGTGAVHFNVNAGAETITDLGKGASVLIVAANASVDATVSKAWTATSATVNHGTATISTDGFNVNLAAVTKGGNGFVINNTGGAAKLTASAGNDTIYGGTGNDTITAGAGNDTIVVGSGAESIIAGKGVDTFVFAAGDSTQTAMDSITGFSKNKAGNGDVIEYSSALTIGGSSDKATSTDASINASTGVATFATGTGKTLSSAVNNIVNDILDHGGDKAGEFAFFKVNGTGNEYLFISDGQNAAGAVDANNTIIKLVGVTSIGGISAATLAADKLSILS